MKNNPSPLDLVPVAEAVWCQCLLSLCISSHEDVFYDEGGEMLAQVVQGGCFIPGNIQGQKLQKSLSCSLRIHCSQRDVYWKLEEKQNKSLLLFSGGKHWSNNSDRFLNEKRNWWLWWFLLADKQEGHYINFRSTLSTLSSGKQPSHWAGVVQQHILPGIYKWAALWCRDLY